MAKVAGPNDLVLLDEIGASTEPNEGAALAVAILEHFRQRGAMAMVTTHHSRLKAYAAETAEALNAAMEFDEATLEPTYRLLVGLPENPAPSTSPHGWAWNRASWRRRGRCWILPTPRPLRWSQGCTSNAPKWSASSARWKSKSGN